MNSKDERTRRPGRQTTDPINLTSTRNDKVMIQASDGSAPTRGQTSIASGRNATSSQSPSLDRSKSLIEANEAVSRMKSEFLDRIGDQRDADANS